MIRRLAVSLSLLVFVQAASAQQNPENARVNSLLTQAGNYFKQDNYFAAVANFQSAAGIVRANPAAGDGTTCMQLATMCLDCVKTNINELQKIGDNTRIAQRVQALQPLLGSMMDWDHANPRWHYEKGDLLCIESMAYNNVGFTMQAKQEYEKCLAMNGGGSFHASAERQLAVCNKAISEGWANARAWDKAHPVQYTPSNSPSDPNSISSMVNQSFTPVFCTSCGQYHLRSSGCRR